MVLELLQSSVPSLTEAICIHPKQLLPAQSRLIPEELNVFLLHIFDNICSILTNTFLLKLTIAAVVTI